MTNAKHVLLGSTLSDPCRVRSPRAGIQVRIKTSNGFAASCGPQLPATHSSQPAVPWHSQPKSGAICLIIAAWHSVAVSAALIAPRLLRDGGEPLDRRLADAHRRAPAQFSASPHERIKPIGRRLAAVRRPDDRFPSAAGGASGPCFSCRLTNSAPWLRHARLRTPSGGKAPQSSADTIQPWCRVVHPALLQQGFGNPDG